MEFGPGFLTTFLYYFTSAAILSAIVIVKGAGMGLETGFPQEIGAIAGLAAGLIGASFNRTTAFSVQFQSQKHFLAELETALNPMGYEQVGDQDGVLVYERSSLSKWFSGKVFVQMEGNMATIASRASTTRQLQKILK
ncbi:MAG: hypothetical protein HC865_26720 [Cyanobacteria bacterium RU_5_0]|nr:hypothetical protein [Cyanobacteria bacterium RU_5_0]